MPAALAAASLALLALSIAACAPETPPPAQTSLPVQSPARTDAAPMPAPTTTATDRPAVAIPTDCKAILTPAVLAQFGTTPLNDPAFGPSGVLSDGSLKCIWGSPSADTTGLSTTISRVARGPALDALNAFRAEGATCYTPSGGTRCERTWKDKTYPVTDGRTMFWRDDVLIDTVYSNLAPTGYTDAIIAHLFG